MWFRIETEKDGTIRSCEQVDESFKNGNNVFYVEANTKESAIVAVKLYVLRRSKKTARNHAKVSAARERGLCGWSRCGKPTGGKFYCEEHRRQIMDAKRRKREFGPTRPHRLSDEEAYERELLSNRAQAKGRKLRVQLDELTQAMAVYLRNPSEFENWCGRRIKTLQAKLDRLAAPKERYEAPQAAE